MGSPKEAHQRSRRWWAEGVLSVLVAALCVQLLGVWIGGNFRLSTGGFEVGVGESDVTPEEPIWLAGFASRNESAKGTLQRLRISAVCLKKRSEELPVCILSFDLIGIDRTLSEQMYDSLQRRFGLSRSNIVLFFSHTHSGPVVGRILEVLHDLSPRELQRIAKYTGTLVSKAGDAVAQALARMEPHCSIWTNSATVCLGVNRRKNSEREFQLGSQTAGPIDHILKVVAVRRADGSEKIVFFSYPGHGTVLTSEYRYSNDWMGFARNYIERQVAGSAAVFIPGCGGDVNLYPRGAISLADAHGRAVAEAAVDAIQKAEEVQGSLTCNHESVNLPYARLTHPERRLARLAKLANSAQEKKLAQLLIARRGELPKEFFNVHEFRLWLCKIGESFALVALSGEVVSEYSLRLRAELPYKSLLVAAYSGEVPGYIPSRQVAIDGGYEAGERSAVYYGLPGLFGTDAENLIIEKVLSSL
mmetsp:Transcript_12683/g.38853  ORF Transcript_12683/g.38853 Transcript_12683/m.38853 type:complete len:474 (-) Transcript_12683:1261-2682(-)|eukprot:CAMPEP_0198726224 /NCGR_PEP_ID=MMETSP1475-20131203/3349_1 /TAXON_ID= ORGANISM="Unidentified sp., Strain CCMP1999" /NCGR_SAMPLE_ID=MMETSP1475 /ASSEMBLY_ACC=CAM_ASM_001111 /LENGTH=473 /DNA_ID=CAMNT_0044488127 /DNA_START=397 /DNA_END=1818 /DNA_ORIENTATION=-